VLNDVLGHERRCSVALVQASGEWLLRSERRFTDSAFILDRGVCWRRASISRLEMCVFIARVEVKVSPDDGLALTISCSRTLHSNSHLEAWDYTRTKC